MSSKRRYIRKYITGILAAVMVVALMPSERLRAEEDSEASEYENISDEINERDIEIETDNNKAISCTAGEKIICVFKVMANKDMENISIQLEYGDSPDRWPFVIEKQKDPRNLESLSQGVPCSVNYEFTARDDIKSSNNGYYAIYLSAYTEDGTLIKKQKFFVNTTAKAKEPDKNDDGGKEPDNKDDTPQDAQLEAGGFSNGEVSYSGGGGEGAGSSSVPRVIVTGFSTNPAEVRAGQDFTLTVHLKNTSKTSRVQNMLFDLSAPTEGADEQTMAPAFLPASGSSSIYLEGINADGAADISINLNAKSDLLQKPYSMDIAMKYEDGEGAQVEASSSLSIPVKQDARFELSEFEINPASIMVGEEANIMFNLYNLGRIKLYNVKATFESENIKREEVFVGNVESGASASIDAMLEGSKVAEGPAKITMTLSYEDEAGKVLQKKEEFEIEVTEPMQEDIGVMEEMPMEESGLPVLPIAVAAAVAAVVIIAVVVVKKNKKKRMKNEEEALLDELDGPSEDERQ